MKFHSIAFFCKRRKIPACHIDIDKSSRSYPAHVKFGEFGNVIDIYLSSLQDLTNFKNSFLSSYEKAMREAKIDQDKAKAINSIHHVTQAEKDKIIAELQEVKDA